MEDSGGDKKSLKRDLRVLKGLPLHKNIDGPPSTSFRKQKGKTTTIDGYFLVLA